MRLYDATWQSTRDGFSRHSVGLEHLPLIHLVNGAALGGDVMAASEVPAEVARANVNHCIENRALMCINRDHPFWSDASLPGRSEDVRDAAHDFFREMSDLFRFTPGGHMLRIGHYGMTAGPHDHDKPGDVERRLGRYKYDRAADGRFVDRGVIDSVDVLFPSIYLKGNDFADAPRRVDRHIEMIYLLAEHFDRPMIPFVWDGKHEENQPHILDMLERLKPMYDQGLIEGFALWRNPAEPWGGDTGIIPQWIQTAEEM